jgi:hypothetical protein
LVARAPLAWATRRLSWISAASRSSPSRCRQRQRRAVEAQLVPEHLFTAEVLEIRVFDPALAQRLVGQRLQVLEDQ